MALRDLFGMFRGLKLDAQKMKDEIRREDNERPLGPRRRRAK